MFFYSLYITLENSPVYAELLRGHYFTTAEHPGSRYRIRRAISLCHRPTSHQHRHQPEVDQSNLASLGSRTDSGRTNNGGLSNVRPQNFDSTILVDDVSSGCYSCCVFERGSTRYRNTELCCSVQVYRSRSARLLEHIHCSTQSILRLFSGHYAELSRLFISYELRFRDCYYFQIVGLGLILGKDLV